MNGPSPLRSPAKVRSDEAQCSIFKEKMQKQQKPPRSSFFKRSSLCFLSKLQVNEILQLSQVSPSMLLAVPKVTEVYPRMVPWCPGRESGWDSHWYSLGQGAKASLKFSHSEVKSSAFLKEESTRLGVPSSEMCGSFLLLNMRNMSGTWCSLEMSLFP